MIDNDTIAAIATAPGKGGVGIVRLSGPLCRDLPKALFGLSSLTPRYAQFTSFLDHQGLPIDEGIALFFEGPHSFTGEDVLELQGHGGPVVLDSLLQRCLQLGARLARPGEFSERAFLNDKMDLTQAEAIADLINASSQQAARNAINSLQGAFSKGIQQLVEDLTRLRIYVEAAIDFPEEEIDFIADGKVAEDLQQLNAQLQRITHNARQGTIQTEGMKVVIAGRPNAGKSSLLNVLAEKESAIVTDIAGTTRDVLREHIHINGMPLHIIDTAGLRDSEDKVEKIGIDRAWQEINSADRILLVVDSTTEPERDIEQIWPEFTERLPDPSKVTLILNKCDLSGEQQPALSHRTIALSAKTGFGIEHLKSHLMQCVGYESTNEGGFTARRRHLIALEKAGHFLQNGTHQLQYLGAGELLAEDLRQAQNALGEITGKVTADDLLGQIFSSFCIGK